MITAQSQYANNVSLATPTETLLFFWFFYYSPRYSLRVVKIHLLTYITLFHETLREGCKTKFAINSPFRFAKLLCL